MDVEGSPCSQSCPYETLGVARGASANEVKRAYRALVLRWHPDKNRDQPELAAERFRAVSEAYALLTDPARREAYHARGRVAENTIPGVFHNAQDLFREVFGSVGGLFGGFDQGGQHSASTSSVNSFLRGEESHDAPVGTPMDAHPWSAPVSRSNSIDHDVKGDPFAATWGGDSPRHNPFAMGATLQPPNCAFGDATVGFPSMLRSDSSSSTITTRVGSVLQTSTTTIADGVKTTRTTLQRPGEAPRDKVETVCLRTGRVTGLSINGVPQPLDARGLFPI